ncbi:LysR substrate-binding domain-containing protein, partial [Parasutterella sp.]|uniref:LysR substrate-binding domain-containing protein n=1 Tax=Parasutterella sp. TaxID=2049037 RepID=UPI0025FD4611
SIRLAIPGSLAGLIAKPLAEFEKLQSLNHTRIEINSYHNINDIQPENFDLIICIQTLPNVRMVAYDIASISYGIFASRDFLAQNKKIKDPTQLENLPLIHSKSEKVLLQGPLQSITITVEPQIRINSDEAMISAAVEGLGIALRIPLWAAESLTKNGSLIQILREWHLPNAPVWLLKHPGRKIHALEKLIPFLKETWSFHPTLSKN